MTGAALDAPVHRAALTPWAAAGLGPAAAKSI